MKRDKEKNFVYIFYIIALIKTFIVFCLDEPVYNSCQYRRKSVFAEAYNPEEDDGDDTKVRVKCEHNGDQREYEQQKPLYFFQVVHPKTDGQRERLQGVAKNCLLFKTLDDSQLIEVIDAMFEKKVESGEFLIREGDDGDFFYIIEEGTYNAMKEDKETKEDKVVFTYVNEGNFGELALLYNMPRAASVQVCIKF